VTRRSIHSVATLTLVAVASSLLQCSSPQPTNTDATSVDASGVTPGADVTVVDRTLPPTPAGAYEACGGRIFDGTTGAFNAAEYDRLARLWNRETIHCRLGPTYDALNERGAPDDRPNLFEPPVDPSRRCGGNGTLATYEFGPVGCSTACARVTDRFGSTSAQVLFEPDDAMEAGADRVLTFGWDHAMLAVRPQPAPGGSHPEPHLNTARWASLGYRSRQPIAIARSNVWWSNDGVAIFEDGFVGALGTRTDGVPEGLRVGFKFPDHLAPTAVALSSMSELAFVTVWDTREHVGRLAVFAMHANFPLAHTWWYIGLPNAGGFTAMKLLGYVDLPMRAPTSVSAVTNGYRGSPHDTAQMPLSSATFALVRDGMCQPSVMRSFALTDPPGAFANVIASHGYVIVASQWENLVSLVDLRPLLGDLRDVYTLNVDRCNREAAPAHVWNPNPTSTQFEGDARFPFPFSRSGAAPVVAATFEVRAPRDVYAGWVRDTESVPPRAYVASDDGRVYMIAPNRLAQPRPVPGASGPATGEPRLESSFAVCAHPTKLDARTSNDSLWLVCRGDRTVQQLTIDNAGGRVSVALRDRAMGDPVSIEVNDRGPILTIADFNGRAVINYQTDAITGFGCAESSAPVTPTNGLSIQRGGVMTVQGTPFAISGANVN
jgi:hypothetical protein